MPAAAAAAARINLPDDVTMLKLIRVGNSSHPVAFIFIYAQ